MPSQGLTAVHVTAAPARQHAKPVRRFKAASGSEAGGWGEARPEWLDTCLDLVAPGAMTDLNVEWQVGRENDHMPERQAQRCKAEEFKYVIHYLCMFHEISQARTYSALGTF